MQIHHLAKFHNRGHHLSLRQAALLFEGTRSIPQAAERPAGPAQSHKAAPFSMNNSLTF